MSKLLWIFFILTTNGSVLYNPSFIQEVDNQYELTFTVSSINDEDICLLFGIDRNGSNLHQLMASITCDDRSFSWSLDGTEFAFFRTGDDYRVNVWKMSVDNSNLTNLTPNFDYAVRSDWSPDGQQIAFAADPTSGNRYIYVMDADGKNIRQITSGDVIDDAPQWSPDTKYLYFVTNIDPHASALDPISLDTYRIHVDGTHRERIAVGGFDAVSSNLLFFIQNNVSEYSSSANILSLDYATQEESILFKSEDEEFWDMALSPDEQYLALASRAGIYIMSPNGTDVQLVYSDDDDYRLTGNLVWRTIQQPIIS